MTKQDFFKQCTVNGNTIHVPKEQIDGKLYSEVKKSFENIGGQWKGGKIWGYVFNEDPTTLFESLKNGKDRNIKQEFQFFETPPNVADLLLEHAYIPSWKLFEDDFCILEPSAGRGRIIDAIYRLHPNAPITACELRDLNREHITNNYPDVRLTEEKDFLEMPETQLFDYVIANPPFTKNQDIKHIRKMYDLVKPGGRVVSIASIGFTFRGDKESREFKNWLEMEVHGWVEELPDGSFKESGTNVKCVIVVIQA